MGETITNALNIAEKFNEYFVTAVSKLIETVRPENVSVFATKKFTVKVFSFKPTEGFIFKQLNDLKAKKATGLDKIPACLLKDSATVIASSLTYIVNLSLSSGVLPDEWKRARVVPMYTSLVVSRACKVTDQSQYFL